MHSYQKFLFYYSLIVLTFLLVVSLFFIPKPQSFFALALFVPIPLYFWLKLTLEGEDNPYRWSLKMLSLLLVIGILGIFAFWLSGKTPDKPPKTTLEETTEEITPSPTSTVLGEEYSEDIKKLLEEIKTDLSQIKAEQRATREILGISGSAEDFLNIINTILGPATGSALPVP